MDIYQSSILHLATVLSLYQSAWGCRSNMIKHRESVQNLRMETHPKSRQQCQVQQRYERKGFTADVII